MVGVCLGTAETRDTTHLLTPPARGRLRADKTEPRIIVRGNVVPATGEAGGGEEESEIGGKIHKKIAR